MKILILSRSSAVKSLLYPMIAVLIPGEVIVRWYKNPTTAVDKPSWRAFNIIKRSLSPPKRLLNRSSWVLFKMNGEKKVVGKVEEEFVKGNQHIRIYKRPQPGGLYVVGADVAEGVEGGDYSFMTIWDRKTGEEVAMFRGLLTPGDFGEFLDKWGRIYNNGLMVVEHNNQGIATLQKLKELSYPCMYFRPTKYESVYTGLSDKIGWRTTPTNKSLLIDQFQDALRKNEMIIHSKETLDEMLVFIYNDNNDMVVPKGFHDDGIMSSSIGYQGFKVMYSKPLEQIDESEHLPTNFSY